MTNRKLEFSFFFPHVISKFTKWKNGGHLTSLFFTIISAVCVVFASLLYFLLRSRDKSLKLISKNGGREGSHFYTTKSSFWRSWRRHQIYSCFTQFFYPQGQFFFLKAVWFFFCFRGNLLLPLNLKEIMKKRGDGLLCLV